MAKNMLIDARHPEETRVAVVDGKRIEDFDFEAEAHKQIRGNIYLAKITRVEPSLQAAFVDYGGNRHGFLAFSEIHPDYYQIPKEDRDALLREEQQIAEEQVEADDEAAEKQAARERAASADSADGDEAPETAGGGQGTPHHGESDEGGAEALRRRRMSLRRRYKIQEVIRRRQVMLVQVVKEERGNKGAALTTYISLAGRYSVLMPNTAQGGGISRKISNAADRKRLKQIVAELNLPVTMGAIVRTAGLKRTKTEIKRDFDYLARLWDEIRERTLASSAPALIYEDSDLIKRAIRDIYNRDIEEVLVDGAEGYTQAKNFMKLLMPSHARRVKAYTEAVPLFHHAGVEHQLAELLDPVVTLKSGGYLVINPTEALVSIDVNSGRSTREYNIEETAVKTNIEAANEVARQLRLRDLAGLVVVDFIDMESHANNRKVERAMKDALKQDRARIQVGRISPFGLLEMSRQRLRTSILEASTRTCPVCDGLGLVRTDGSAALAALRLLEDEAVRGRAACLRLKADTAVAVYLWNNKRSEIIELETRYGVSVLVEPDAALIGGRFAVEASGTRAARPAVATVAAPSAPEPDEDEPEIDDIDEVDEGDEGEAPARDEASSGRNGRRRRGGRNRNRDSDRKPRETASDTASGAARADEASADAAPAEAGHAADGNGGGESREGRGNGRRGGRRRGGRNRNRSSDEAAADSHADESAETTATAADAAPADAATAPESAAASEAVPADADASDDTAARSRRPRRRGSGRSSRQAATAELDAADASTTAAAAAQLAPEPAQHEVAGSDVVAEAVSEPAAEAAADATPAEPANANTATDAAASEEPAPAPAADDGDAAPRRGWWQRTFGN